MEQEALNKIIAENMIKYRKAANLTQLELAEKLNYSDKSVSKWEQGNGMPDLFVLYKLSQLYGVTVNDLIYPHEKEVPMPENKKRFFNRWMIVFMSVGLVWLVAVIAFVGIQLFHSDFAYAWLPFVYALPAMFVVTVVLSSIWKFFILRIISASALLWTILLALCLSIWIATGLEKAFSLFFIGIPLQVLIFLWFFFRHRLYKKQK